MKYYKFNHQVDTDEVGHVEGHLHGIGKKGYDKDAPNSWYKVPFYNEFTFPSDNLDLDYLSVDRKANLTDVLSLFKSGCGFVLSDKFKQILDKMNLPPHRYYPAILKHKKNLYQNYVYLHTIWNTYQHTQHDKSVFEVWENYYTKYPIPDTRKLVGTITPTSKVDFEQQIEEYRKKNIMIQVINRLLVFDELNFDLFPMYPNFCCSERLYEAIKSEGITGLDIQPIDFEIRVENDAY